MLELKSPEYLFICFLGFVMMLANGMAFPIMPLFAKRLTESTWLIGFVGTAFWLARMVLEVPTGLLSDRISKHKIIFTGMIVSCISLVFTSLVTNIYELIVLRMCAAIGSVLFFVSTLAYIAEHFPSKTRGKALGTLQAVEFSTITLASPLGGYLATIKGFRFVFIVGAFLLVCTILSAVASGVFTKKVDFVSKRGRNHRVHSFQNSLRMLLIGNVVISSSTIFIAQLPDNVLTIIGPLYMEEVLGMKPIEIGLILATRGVGVGFGALFGGFLFDKLYPKLHLANYVLAFAIAGLATNLFTLVSFLPILSLLALILGLAFGIVYSAAPSLAAASTTTRSAGTTMGIWRTFFDLGGSVFPIMLTTVAEFADLIAPFHLASYIMLSCMILFVILTFVKYTKMISSF